MTPLLHKRPLDEKTMAPPERSAEWIVLDEVLKRLSQSFKHKAQIIESRYFLGLTIDEAAALGMKVDTVKRDWRTG